MSDCASVPIRRLGTHALEDGHHFFGYYNKTPWDASCRYVLAQRTPWHTAELRPELEAVIGCFDRSDGDRFIDLGRTTAWNWQMGSQLQWLDGAPGTQLIYNHRSSDACAVFAGLGSTVIDMASGSRRVLPLPVYVVAPNSAWALCVDYRRLYITHQTIGYAEAGGPHSVPLCPVDDGIRWMDLVTGDHRLAMSHAQLRAFDPRPSMDNAIHWVSHIEVSPDSRRVLFLHRWTERVEDETCFLHRLMTMDPDGANLRLLECSDHPLPQLQLGFDANAVGTFDYEKSEYQISHPLWRRNGQLVVWGPHAGRINYHLYDDAPAGAVAPIGPGQLAENGHMSFSPVNPRWMLSDTYPDDRTHDRELFLYDLDTGCRHVLGRFFADPHLGKENRCDLHPRFSRDGRQVCIDSVHEGARQMYVLDIGAIVD